MLSPTFDIDSLRRAIQLEYVEVAEHPEYGFHFLVGRPLARVLGYDPAWLEGLPEGSIESFAGTGNPFSLRLLAAGERVVDVGSGAGIDSLIFAECCPDGRTVGARHRRRHDTGHAGEGATGGLAGRLHNLDFRAGTAEALPICDGWADVVISNGVLNLMPDKHAGLAEMARVLKPGGRIQIGDILVQHPVPESARQQIDLWTG
jgi:arsenite methyltransferase